jgi:16S rRNA (cytidine1402-2'-O)-methyltransferase
MRGELYLIGTPIGNLGDLSPRAQATLGALDVLYCEDTRVTGKLTALLNLSVRLVALSDDHSERRIAKAIEAVNAGYKAGFCADAGMPGVSDPGRRLVRAAWAAGITPTVIPGPSSPSTLLAACPFIDNCFRFAGYPPRRDSDRSAFVARLAASPEPNFFFESPHRVHAVLDLLTAAVEPQRELLIGREMTKLHEQLVLFTAGEWPDWQSRLPTIGEFTVAIAGSPPVEQTADEEAQLLAELERLLAAGFTRRDAVKALAAVREISANALKKLLY